MTNWGRREFLGTTLASLSASLFVSPGMLSAQTDSSKNGNSPDSLFLTWQQDPTSTMTIQWVGDEEAWPKEIQYCEHEQSNWQTASTITKPFPDTNLRVFRCELSGLSPETEYQFRIGSAGDIHRFRTMPAKTTNTIQFVSGGDAGVNKHAIATNIIAAKQEPWFALIGGDLAYDNGRSPETFLGFLRNYSAHMVDPSGRMIPMIACIGNHEVDGGYGGTREKAPHYLSVFDGLYRETTYNVLDIGDYMSLVLMDTGHITPVIGEQTDWLEKTLASRQDRRHLIVANHVPAYPSYRAPIGKEGKHGTGELQRLHWCPLFERYNVDLVLEHHDHTFKRTHPLIDGMRDKNGILYLGDGSWGQIRAPKSSEERPYLAAVSAAYHMTVHRFEGDERFHVALEATGKLADVCRTAGKRAAL